MHDRFFGRPFVKRFALCYRTVVCLSVCPVLSVCLSVCNVGVLWPSGVTDQDDIWHAGRPRTWPHSVRWRPSSPSPKGAQPLPIFGPYPLRPNGCIHQDATWYGGRPRPRRLYVRWGPRFPPQKGDRAPKFLAHAYCGQTAGWIKMVLGVEIGLSPSDFVLSGDSARPLSFRPMFIIVITGSIARSANLPVFSLLRGQF